MFDHWLGLPRWTRAMIAVAILIYPAILLADGVIWPWAWAVGGTLLVLSFPRPLGPPRNRDRRPRGR